MVRYGPQYCFPLHDNEKDLADMPDTVLNGLDIVPVRWVDEVMEAALDAPLKPLKKSARAKAAKKSAKAQNELPTQH